MSAFPKNQGFVSQILLSRKKVAFENLPPFDMGKKLCVRKCEGLTRSKILWTLQTERGN